MRKLGAVAVIGLGVVACAGETGLQPRPWELELPRGLTTHVYPPVTEEIRATHRIELVEDLVIGNEDDPNARFGHLDSVAVDDAGRIFVPDTDNHRVQVFDEDGEFLATLGREGEGPGEMISPRTIATRDDRLFVVTRRKVSIWSTSDFELIDEIVPERGINGGLGVSADGLPLVSGLRFDEVGDTIVRRAFAAVLQPDGSTLPPIVVSDLNPEPDAQSPDGQYAHLVTSPHARNRLTSSSDGVVYHSRTSEYQVMAVRSDGVPEWALQVAEAPPAFDGSLLQDWSTYITDLLATQLPGVEPNPPSHLPMIGDLRVDGHDRLHVYHFHPEWKETNRTHDVDVYDARGQRLFTGSVPSTNWSAARGDYVYGSGVDPVTEEYRVYRWRLTLPHE